MQLQMFTEELTKCRKNVDKVAQDVNITVGDLGIHKFGILSILRFNSFDKDNSEPQLSYDVGDQGEDENMGYGSTTWVINLTRIKLECSKVNCFAELDVYSV